MSQEKLTNNEREQKIKEYIERLKRLKDASDEIPEEVLHGEGNFKVRKNWWWWLYDVLGGLEMGHFLSPELLEASSKFQSKYDGASSFARRLTTKEDIEEANQLIDGLIKFLESQ